MPKAISRATICELSLLCAGSHRTDVYVDCETDNPIIEIKELKLNHYCVDATTTKAIALKQCHAQALWVSILPTMSAQHWLSHWIKAMLTQWIVTLHSGNHSGIRLRHKG